MFTLTQVAAVAAGAFVLGLVIPFLFILAVIWNANIKEE